VSWHPFSGPWGAFIVGMLAGAWLMTAVFGVALHGWRYWLGMKKGKKSGSL
jgi:hypothetical protein